MRNIDSQILKLIESCSKDKDSQEKLKEFFSIIADKRDEACNHLALLENAIKHDYDSILITELELDRPGPRIVYVNDGFTKMTGYSKEEVIGKFISINIQNSGNLKIATGRKKDLSKNKVKQSCGFKSIPPPKY